jgi:RimJ/RimL family protein N-acetyltransferase
MRLADYEKNAVRLGFIVVDPTARGKGFGKKMIEKALQYAFGVLGMKRASLGVFENNPQAKACYEAVGFTAKAYVPDYHVQNGITYAAYEMEAVSHEENK